MKKSIQFILVILLCFSCQVHAQERSYVGNPDASFYMARDLAFGGNYHSARDTLKRILTRYPDYSDVRNLLAKTYSWDANYEAARAHFNKITSVDRKNKEVWIAAVNNEIYANNLHIALGLSNKALLFLPEDPELLELNKDVLDKLETSIVEGEKSDENPVFTNQVAIYNSFDVFDVVYEPMIYSGVEYTRFTAAGKIIPRLNYANRFDTHGLQYELDFYPEFSKTFYGYLNYGYSDADIFPAHRIGAELYSNLPNAKEASLGVRYLDFLDEKATIYTGSFGLYKGDYYFSLRPYITPNPEGSMGVSGTLTARKYLKDKDHYLGLLMGMGFNPELKQLTANSTLLAETLLFVESQQLFFEYQFTGKSPSNMYRAHLGITHQELVFEPGNFFWAFTAGLRYHVRF